MSLRKIASLLVLVFTVQLGLARNANAQSAAEIVIEWNRILQATLAIPGALPAQYSTRVRSRFCTSRCSTP